MEHFVDVGYNRLYSYFFTPQLSFIFYSYLLCLRFCTFHCIFLMEIYFYLRIFWYILYQTCSIKTNICLQFSNQRSRNRCTSQITKNWNPHSSSKFERKHCHSEGPIIIAQRLCSTLKDRTFSVLKEGVFISKAQDGITMHKACVYCCA
jgi:hypothetical protein